MFIVASSKQQPPANFISNFINSVNISDGYEVALIAIYHGPLFNIDEDHNTFSIVKDDQIIKFRIPIGFYRSSTDILIKIHEILVKYLGDVADNQKITVAIKRRAEDAHYVITLKDAVKFKVEGDESDVLQYLGYLINNERATLQSDHIDLQASLEPAFIYSNIVGESKVDGFQSRVLASVPLYSSNSVGYNYYEYKNPIYHPLRVRSFADIEFQIRDKNGDLIQIADYYVDAKYPHYPTILMLDIRKVDQDHPE